MLNLLILLYKWRRKAGEVLSLTQGVSSQSVMGPGQEAPGLLTSPAWAPTQMRALGLPLGGSAAPGRTIGSVIKAEASDLCSAQSFTLHLQLPLCECH